MVQCKIKVSMIQIKGEDLHVIRLSIYNRHKRFLISIFITFHVSMSFKTKTTVPFFNRFLKHEVAFETDDSIDY